MATVGRFPGQHNLKPISTNQLHRPWPKLRRTQNHALASIPFWRLID